MTEGLGRGRDRWDKLGILAALIASVAVPIVAVVIGNEYTSALKEAENRVKYIELAISILNASPTAQSEHVRRWAADVINKYSEVPMNEQTREELLRNQLLGKVDTFVSDTWVPAFSKNLMAEVKKNPDWNAALQSHDREKIEQNVEELLVDAARAVLEERRSLARQYETSHR